MPRQRDMGQVLVAAPPDLARGAEGRLRGASRRTGLRFGLLPADDDADSKTKAYVEKAIGLYESEGRESMVEYYNSPESLDGELFLMVVSEDDKLLTSVLNPMIVGRDITTVNYLGDLAAALLGATEEGQWSEHDFFNPATPEDDRVRVWLIRHDGLVFAAGHAV